ncbi:MAG: xylose isomerase [Sphingomonas sp. 32-66-10]|nr:MAG: xylose isomerase [Sphingomonas sp. 32-66-10]
MQQLKVSQALWAMERRRPDGHEWPLDVQLQMIKDAGFDGAGVDFADIGYAREVTAVLRENGMMWHAMSNPTSVEAFAPVVANAVELGCDHINLQPNVRPRTLAECVPYIEGWLEMGRAAGVPVHIETHRDRMTTDLHFTLDILDRFPGLRLTADLSHFLVGREFQWPIDATNHAMMHRICDNAWGFHGRVASREQVQVQISFPHQKDWLDTFMGWWEYGFRSWRRRAPKDATLTFLCELGPREYAMTGPDGYELSDRWQESQMLKDMVRALWKRLEAEDASTLSSRTA